MNDRLWWKIVPGTRSQRDDMAGVPAGILTAGARFHHESMPQEVAMLLPTSHGPARLIDEVVENPWGCEGVMLGLFLGGPFLNVALENGRLHRSGITWIANLPSVEQQDLEFSRQLSDVGLDLDHELNSLGQFKAGGFHTAAVVADARGNRGRRSRARRHHRHAAGRGLCRRLPVAPPTQHRGSGRGPGRPPRRLVGPAARAR